MDHEPRTEWVRSGSAELAVAAWGPDDAARTVVALHPGVGDARIWRWCAPTWVDAGLRVVAPDRRGFGATRYAAEPHDDLADLVAVTEALSVRPAIVVGNSMGGALALDLAVARPDDVEALVLLSPAASGYDESDWPTTEAEDALDHEIAAAEESGDLDAVNRLEVRYWLDGVEEPEGRVGGDARDLMVEMNRWALGADPTGEPAERPAAWPSLGRISVPVVVAVGEHDLPGFSVLGRALAAEIDGARFVTVRGAAHCPSLDAPDAVADLVLSVLP